MTMLVIGLAAAVAASSAPALPHPIGSPGGWITSADYPKDALRFRERGYVPFSLTVSPAGEPTDCTAYTQSKLLRQVVCRLLVERARFTPARDGAGQAHHGIYRSRIAFRLDRLSMPASAEEPDTILTVSALPAGSADPATVSIAYLVGADGRIGACAPTTALGTAAPLGEIACQEARRTTRAEVVRGSDGQPASSIQPQIVRFRTANATAVAARP